MSIFTWMDRKIKKLNWFDIDCVKLSTAALTLMLAKLWEPLLSLDWYWYLLLALLFVLKPLYKVFVMK